MEHKMKLQPEHFDYMKNGTKRIELRLNDEKRKALKINDTIKFLREPEIQESFNVKVIGLLQYSNFRNLFNDFDISILADSSITKEQLLSALQQFYTIEDQNKYGVLGIRIELI